MKCITANIYTSMYTNYDAMAYDDLKNCLDTAYERGCEEVLTSVVNAMIAKGFDAVPISDILEIPVSDVKRLQVNAS